MLSNMSKIVIKILLIFNLVSCSTTSKSTYEIQYETTQTKIAKINTELGMAYFQNGDLHRSKQKFLLALQKAPKLPEAWYCMAYFIEQSGDKELAEKYYLKAIELAPARGDTHNNYGTFLCRTGQYYEAIQQFLLATKDPCYLDTASAFENAGLCAEKIPNNRLAIAYFSKAIEQDPSLTGAEAELKKLQNIII